MSSPSGEASGTARENLSVYLSGLLGELGEQLNADVRPTALRLLPNAITADELDAELTDWILQFLTAKFAPSS